ncbi:MAG TPA: hypothetical protein VEP50_19230 [bacterium]|nr:hypothetical protein [bacterium]
MPIDADRNRVLLALRDRPQGVRTVEMADTLGLPQDAVERHLQYCADYALATWDKKKDRTGLAVITDRGRDYLTRQGL